MKFRADYIGIALLAVGYVFSAGRAIHLQAQAGARDAAKPAIESVGEGNRVITVAHWQLEPGYREAMQWAIDTYNALPHVKEAGVVVEQMPITQRVYTQFMNVHLISGTAPDIAARGRTVLVEGNNVARFYAPLGQYGDEPNPYNREKLLPPDLPADLKHALSTQPWSETFVDGMRGGFDESLQDIYAVPVSLFGNTRIFYNMELLNRGKALIRAAVDARPQPEWLRHCWIRKDGEKARGFLPDTPELRSWLAGPELPETLGQLLLYCEAIKTLADENEKHELAPISGSNYYPSNLAGYYRVGFFDQRRETLDWDMNSVVNDLETLAGWETGKWSFSEPDVRAYFEMGGAISAYFPKGFLGLDREQAQRRFVTGNAAMISSGAWDAAGIFDAVAARKEGGFEVKVGRPPAPRSGERWASSLSDSPSEANIKSAVPLSINKASPNFEWALDFLRFISSMPVNEELNRRAGWLPAIVGARPVERMAPFASEFRGADPRGGSLFLGFGLIGSIFESQIKLLFSGDIQYATLVERAQEAFNNPRHGVRSVWSDAYQRQYDQTLAGDAALTAIRVRGLLQDEEQADRKYLIALQNQLPTERGRTAEWFWRSTHPEENFPRP